MYMRPDDLCKLPESCVNTILHECPFLAKPENQDDGLPAITEYTHNSGKQPTIPKKVVLDHRLVFATRSNVSRPNNITIHNGHDRSLATSTSIQGFIKTSKIPVTENEDPNCNGDISPLAIRRIRAPPLDSRLYSFGNFTNKWSWVILPSPYERYPFSQTSVRTFTTAFILHEAFPHRPEKPLWNSEAWRIARSIPNDAAVTFLWKYLNRVVINNKVLDDYPTCKHCQGFTSLNHILFKCPASQELWREFDKLHGLTIPPSQRLINRCRWRIKGSKKTPPILAQLEFLHLYHVWSTWWSLQKSPDDPNVIHPHSWLRRVITCYLCLNDRTHWDESPYIQNYLSDWKKLHHVPNIEL